MKRRMVIIGSIFTLILLVFSSLPSVVGHQSLQIRERKNHQLTEEHISPRVNLMSSTSTIKKWTPGYFFWMFTDFLIELYGVLPHDTLLWKILDFFATWIILTMLLIFKSIWGNGPPMFQ